MLKFMCKRQGTISIFLIIVLVPMLTLASIFVDMSRIKLGRSVAESAGDLTLNTALTDYDAVLKDMYGLFATSQNIDELYESLEDYYRRSIEAAGVSEADADNYVDQIMGMLKSETGSDDLLNMSLKEFTVTKPTGASLANPAILKSQIVNFMKYRAPLSLGTGFIDALSSMKNLDKQTKLVNDKNNFYKEQKDLLSELEEAWNDIQKYQYSCKDDGFPKGTYLGNQKSALDKDADDLEDDLEDAIEDSVKYLYYKDEFYANNIDISYDEDDDKWGFKWFGESVNCKPDYKAGDTVSSQKVLEELNNVMKSIKEVNKYTKNSSYNSVYNLISQGKSSDIEKIYAVVQFNEAGKTGYSLAIKNLLLNLIDLQSAYRCCSASSLVGVNVRFDESKYEYVLDEGSTTALTKVCNDQISDHLKIDNEGGGQHYLYYFEQYTDRLDQYYNSLNSTIEKKESQVNDTYKKMCEDAANLDSMLDARITDLTNAVTHLQSAKNMLTDGSNYTNALKEWQSSASKLSDDTMGKNDSREIAKVKELITSDKIDKLITRLNKAKATLQSIKTQVAQYKYEGTAWKDIDGSKGYSDLIDRFTSDQKNRIESTKPSGYSSYDSVISEIKNTVTKGSFSGEYSGDDSPDLTSGSVTQMYTWLYNNYYDVTRDYSSSEVKKKSTSGDADLKNNKDSLKKSADENKDKPGNKSTEVSTNISTYKAYLPSTEFGAIENAIKAGAVETDSDALLKSSSESTGNILSQVMGLLDNMGTTLRDDLYISSYIMGMFSYDTYEAEIMKENGGDLKKFKSWYTKGEDGKYKVADGVDSKYPAKALSITKNSINPNMNYLYGSEVEYIIYGDSDANASKTKAYGTIFLLRFAFNTVYAFTDAEINNTTMAAATAIFGTPPLTPLIPIAKAAMTVGLAIAESAYDLYILKTGEQVPLMKNSKTWFMKPSTAAKKVVGTVASDIVDGVIDKGYNVLSDALEKTDAELQELIDGGKKSIENLADSAFDSTLDKFNNYGNEALQKVVELCNEQNANIMMNKLVKDESSNSCNIVADDEMVKNVADELDKWLKEQGSSTDDAIYEVKKVAVDYLKSNNNAAIKGIYESIQKTAGSKEEVNSLNVELSKFRADIETEINKLSEQANSKLNSLQKEFKGKIKEAAKNGAESLRSELQSQIGKTFGTSAKATTETTTVVSSLLSWSYSDYITLFLLIGLVADEKSVLLRTADVIELNMQHMNGEYASITTEETVPVSRFFGLWKTKKTVTKTEANQAAFKLSKASTYLTINAKVEVKPLLMRIPLLEDATSELTGSSWYEIQYSGTLGY